MDEKLKLMRFWLFGTFVIVFAAVSVYVGGVLKTGLLIFTQTRFWIAMLIVAVLCIAWYYIYKALLSRKQE